jgi:hypothetical protein
MTDDLIRILIAAFALAIAIPIALFAYLWVSRPSPWERRP